jgi:hypothetical protein
MSLTLDFHIVPFASKTRILSLFGSSASGQCGGQGPRMRSSLHFVRQGFDIRKCVIYPVRVLVDYVCTG